MFDEPGHARVEAAQRQQVVRELAYGAGQRPRAASSRLCRWPTSGWRTCCRPAVIGLSSRPSMATRRSWSARR